MSTFPLDLIAGGSPAGTAASASGITAAPGETPAGAFSELLAAEPSTETTPPSGTAPATPTPSPLSDAALSNAGETTPMPAGSAAGRRRPATDAVAAEQEILAGWMAANGFVPTEPAVAPQVADAEASLAGTETEANAGEMGVLSAPSAETAGAAATAVSAERITRRVDRFAPRAAIASAAAAAGEKPGSVAVPSGPTGERADSAAPAGDAAAPVAGLAADESTTASGASANASTSRPADVLRALARAEAAATPGSLPLTGFATAARETMTFNSAFSPGVTPVVESGSVVSVPATVATADAAAAVVTPTEATEAPGIAMTGEDAAADAPVTELSFEQVVQIVESRGRAPRNAPAQGATSGEQTFADAAANLPRNPGTEKFAASLKSVREVSRPRAETGEKITVESKTEQFTDAVNDLGINAAKPDALMPALAPSASSSSAVAERLLAAGAHPFSYESAVAEQADTAHAEVAHAARRSVESAIAVAEHFASGEKRAVTLQFSVSGVDLGVRVELRASGVHTTFRTDSPELRAALAQEWQSIAPTQVADRTGRMADPVFTSASSGNSGFSSNADSAGSEQRGSHAREDSPLSPELAGARSLLRSRNAVTQPVMPVQRTSPFSTSGRLHTFA